MGENSKIQWTDHTFNPWIGCSKVHAGCTNCYAETLMATRYGKVEWGHGGTRMVTSPSNWAKPLKWNRDAKIAGERRRVFCASLADVFEDWDDNPVLDHHGCTLIRPDGLQRQTMRDVRRRLFELIDGTPFLDWQLLTKRPENVRDMWPARIPQNVSEYHMATIGLWTDQADEDAYRPNVWIGTSVSDQGTASVFARRLSHLGDLTPVMFLSAEPLIDFVDLTRLANGSGETIDVLRAEVTIPGRTKFRTSDTDPINWVIVGGESGQEARPCRQTWIRDIVRQCVDADVPCFVKQFGSNAEEGFGVNRKLRLNDKKGSDPAEWPEDLRVRQLPEFSVSV